MNFVRFYFVRHGENLANLTKEFSCKKVDYPLTAKGVIQAEQTADFLAAKTVSAVYSSPLLRCRQTAAVIANRTGLQVEVEEGLREVNVGSLEGQLVSQALWDEHNAIIRSWCEGSPEITFPEGENLYELAHRLKKVLYSIINTHQGREIVIVGHGGLFTFGLPMVFPTLDINRLIQNPNHNCSITTVDIYGYAEPYRVALCRWAQVDHLSGSAAEFVHGVPQEGELKQVTEKSASRQGEGGTLK